METKALTQDGVSASASAVTGRVRAMTLHTLQKQRLVRSWCVLPQCGPCSQSTLAVLANNVFPNSSHCSRPRSSHTKTSALVSASCPHSYFHLELPFSLFPNPPIFLLIILISLQTVGSRQCGSSEQVCNGTQYLFVECLPFPDLFRRSLCKTISSGS